LNVTGGVDCTAYTGVPFYKIGGQSRSTSKKAWKKFKATISHIRLSYEPH